MKAFMDVRTARRLADGVQIQAPEFGFERVNLFEVRGALAKPTGQARLGRLTRFELDQRIGRQLIFSHDRILETGSFQLRSGLRLRG